MYILNIIRIIEKCQSLKSKILSLKTIINELDFLSRTLSIISKKEKQKIRNNYLPTKNFGEPKHF